MISEKTASNPRSGVIAVHDGIPEWMKECTNQGRERDKKKGKRFLSRDLTHQDIALRTHNRHSFFSAFLCFLSLSDSFSRLDSPGY